MNNMKAGQKRCERWDTSKGKGGGGEEREKGQRRGSGLRQRKPETERVASAAAIGPPRMRLNARCTNARDGRNGRGDHTAAGATPEASVPGATSAPGKLLKHHQPVSALVGGLQ